MRLRRLSLLPAVLLVPVFITSLQAQSLLPDIVQAHGGAAALAHIARVEVTGALTQGDQTLGFTLKANGGQTRLEIGRRVAIKQAGVFRWFEGQIASDVQPLGNGDQDAYLLPFLALSELASRYKAADSKDGFNTFQAKSERRRFIGYSPDTELVELDFNAETHLLARARFFTAEGTQTPVTYEYSDYRLVGQVPVPYRVAVRQGDTVWRTLTLANVNLEAGFSDNEFSFSR
jgi:hypothetical protein